MLALLPFFSFDNIFGEPLEEVLAVTITPRVVTSLGVPSGLAANVISSSQIDLSWLPVAGAVNYKVYRDGGFIGSSATTSYSDISLSPATNYTYRVSSVDIGGIESGQSDPVSATTLAAPAAPEEEEGGALPILPPIPEVTPESLVINSGASYTTSRDVFLSLSARNASQVAVSNLPDFSDAIWESYKTSKIWRLTEGEGVKSVYAKFRNSSGGVSGVISDAIIFDITSPLNVSGFEAIPGDEQIILNWENPPDEDFLGVRIKGSTEFYPSSPDEGILVYDGSGETFLAVGLKNGVRYYYTVFSYDRAGNLSSGAIVSAVPQKEKPPVPPAPPVPPPPVPPVPPLPPAIEELELEDFSFWQEGELLLEEEKIKAKTDKPLRIALDYEKVPEVLKTIMVTLEKEGKYFSFLLRINEEKTKMVFDYKYNALNDPTRSYYRSDHYPYARYGIPAIFYFSGPNEDTHEPTDDVEKIDFKKFEKVTRHIYSVGFKIANLDNMLEVDKGPKKRGKTN